MLQRNLQIIKKSKLKQSTYPLFMLLVCWRDTAHHIATSWSPLKQIGSISPHHDRKLLTQMREKKKRDAKETYKLSN
jgi:hypothetical protein